MSQENDPSKKPLPIIHTDPSIDEVRAGLNKQLDTITKRLEKYLEILEQIGKKEKDKRWTFLFAQTIIAYQELRLLYKYVDGLWHSSELQLDFSNRISKRVEGIKGEHEHFKKEDLPLDMGKFFKTAFETMLAQAVKNAEEKAKNYEGYVA